MKTIENKYIWTSEVLINIGIDLWRENKHGHALLFVIGSQIGLKIGDLLELTWKDLTRFKGGHFYALTELKLQDTSIEINDSLAAFIELSCDQLNPRHNDYVFINYKTGNRLTTASLNRDLRNISEKIRKESLKDFEGVSIGEVPLAEAQKSFLETPIKTKDIELAWARDEVIARGQTRQAFIWVSNYLNHKNTKYTIELLGLEELPDQARFNHQENHLKLQEFLDTEDREVVITKPKKEKV